MDVDTGTQTNISRDTGSNTSNFAVVWIAPKRNFAVLVMTNVAGDGVSERVDEVIRALLDKFLLNP